MGSLIWHVCSLISCSIAGICLSQSLFFQLQFGQTMIWGIIFTTIDMNIMTMFIYKAEQIHEAVENVSSHHLEWLMNVFVECGALLLVTAMVVLAKTSENQKNPPYLA
ncbi:hypothetical protein ACFE04_014058 [Oxalis oulophora]